MFYLSPDEIYMNLFFADQFLFLPVPHLGVTLVFFAVRSDWTPENETPPFFLKIHFYINAVFQINIETRLFKSNF